MTEVQLFYIALAVWGICGGTAKLIGNEVLATVGAVASIVTGVLALLVAF